MDTLGQARESADSPGSVVAAEQAWSEAAQWMKGNLAVQKFSSPLTIQAIRQIGEAAFRNVHNNGIPALKGRFIQAFQELS